MSDVLLAEIIRLASIILSISIVNFVVGYRKNCEISIWKNMAIQSAIVLVIFIVSRYMRIWNISIVMNEKIHKTRIVFNLIQIIKNCSFSMEQLVWIILNIIIMLSITLIYKKIYNVDWKKFIYLYILSGQYLSVIEDFIVPRTLFAIQTGKSLSLIHI